MIDIIELEKEIDKLYLYNGDAGFEILEKEDVMEFIKENFVPKKEYEELKLKYKEQEDTLSIPILDRTHVYGRSL